MADLGGIRGNQQGAGDEQNRAQVEDAPRHVERTCLSHRGGGGIRSMQVGRCARVSHGADLIVIVLVRFRRFESAAGVDALFQPRAITVQSKVLIDLLPEGIARLSATDSMNARSNTAR